MRKVRNTRRPWTRGVAVSALVLGMATLAPTGAGAQDVRAQAGSFSVSQKNIQFNPIELNVAIGDTVTWTNHETDGQTIHSVVQSGGSEINSPDIPPETSFSWTFTQVQTYNIVCRFHPDMFMTVNVAEAKAAKGAKGDKTTKTSKTSKSAKAKKGKKATTANHASHSDSAAKSVPAPAPGAPDSTIPGIAGLPISPENDQRPGTQR